ncbi:MAG: site-specific DNA-methyltransferase [Nitrospirae bacterium]|nr:site-specific DNA-methyltransferase [Nitrospirota bacterium]
MPTLNWIGKEAVVNHHHQVPYHLLKDVPNLACGESGDGNLIVQGDNLVALKALLPYYAGQVKCIYIDPPYNTGNEGWAYNDNVSSPIIREWLGKSVGREAEDLSRHDKWLCMMYPRLQLLKQFLAPDGVMFISIDDIELPFLRILMDELFPHPQAKNRLACFIWETDGNFDNQAKVKDAHEYILAYSKCFEEFPAPPVIDLSVGKDSKLFRPEIRNTIVKNGPKNPVSLIALPTGFPADFQEGRISARQDKWPHYDRDLVIQGGVLAEPVVAQSGWSSKAICEEFINSKFQPVLDSKGQKTRFVITSTGAIEAVKVRSESQSHVISVIREVGSTQNTSEVLADMGVKFTFPKPVGLIAYLVSMVTDKSALILDSFAGSGTTGHAVLSLNKQDGGKRRFILVEMESKIAREITAERVRRVAEGYKNAKGEKVEGLGGGFRYCELGEPLFDESGKIREIVSFSDLARHVYFTETGEPLPRERVTKSSFIGECRGVGIYLLFNGILGDKRAQGGNVLTRLVLEKLPKFDGQKVIYCAGCLLGKDRLQAERILIRQTPYEIKVS